MRATRNALLLPLCVFNLLFTPAVSSAQASSPKWIWLEPLKERQTVYLRRVFEIDGQPRKATFSGSCDNHMSVFVNEQQITQSGSWETPVSADIRKALKPGKNVITIVARNDGGPAGFIGQILLEPAEGKKRALGSDRTWQANGDRVTGWRKASFEARGWAAATEIAALGGDPWSAHVNAATLAGARPARPVTATPPSKITTLPGFEVELLHTVPKGLQGSWVSLTVDPKGRLIAGDQYGGLYRITPAAIGADAGETKVEKLAVDAGGAHGLLWAFDSLYLVRSEGGASKGLYRLRDTDGDDELDEVRMLRAFRGGGEHGPHAVILAPDGKSLYICAGNHTDLPQPETSVVPRVWAEDLLLPRQWDANGHARGRMAPGGWIARTDPDGKSFEIVSVGYRNEFDIALDREGELFTYDADMEWDVGAPWYRPTRVNHATSGSEFGWRSGTGKWPEYYPDSLGSVVDVGPGSPTGIAFGHGTKFPRKYRDALYIHDWSYGKMYAVHLKPDGSSYKGQLEQFVSASPLPLTDLIVRPQDGALYFLIGGRGTQSGLYRVTYTGTIDDGPAVVDARAAALRRLRREIEALHGPAARGQNVSDAALEIAWQALEHDDRAIRFAARTAIELQPIDRWRQRALAQETPRATIETALALARHADRSLQGAVLERLAGIGWQHAPLRLPLLRAYGLVFIRMGRPEAAMTKRLGDRFGAHYPSANADVNRELCRLLVYLEADDVVEKTLDLLEKAPTQEEQIHYAYCLRSLRSGWTLSLRKRYFTWFQSGRAFRGGASFAGFIRNIKNEAVKALEGDDRTALADVLRDKPAPDLLATLPKPKGPGKEWSTEMLTPLLREGLTDRDFDNGKTMFAAARCFLCHRFDGQGGAMGPDLTGLAGRFSHQDLLDAILDPSKTVSDQYRATVFILTNGSVITGRIVNMGGDNLNVNTDMLSPGHNTNVHRKTIASTAPSPTSMMPAGLLKTLSDEEVLDLMAYLLSRGDRNAAFFKRGK